MADQLQSELLNAGGVQTAQHMQDGRAMPLQGLALTGRIFTGRAVAVACPGLALCVGAAADDAAQRRFCTPDQ